MRKEDVNEDNEGGNGDNKPNCKSFIKIFVFFPTKDIYITFVVQNMHKEGGLTVLTVVQGLETRLKLPGMFFFFFLSY